MVSAGFENMWSGGGGADVEVERWRRERRARERYMISLVVDACENMKGRFSNTREEEGFVTSEK